MGYPQYAGAESSNQLYFFPPRRYRIDRQQVIFILISWASHKKKNPAVFKAACLQTATWALFWFPCEGNLNEP